VNVIEHCIGEDGYCTVCNLSAEYLLAKATARIAQLEALIADAPHEHDCRIRTWGIGKGECNCFKSRALDTGAKG
jgi:hypothetical protein